MLLRRFTDVDGLLWVHNKRQQNAIVRAAKPESVFFEKQLYISRDADGNKDPSVEHHFAEIEGRASQVINKILEAARSGREPRLSSAERDVWNFFLFYQWKRTPDTSNRLGVLRDFDRMYDDSIQEFERRYRPLTEDEKLEFRTERKKADIKKSARVKTYGATPGEKVQSILKDMGIACLVIDDSKKAFVIGSSPVIKLSTTSDMRLGSKDVEVWLPIASDVAVCLIPEPGKEKVLKPAGTHLVRQLNSWQFRQSTMIAGRSRRLIESLSRSR